MSKPTKIFDIVVGCTVQAYTHVEVQARTAKEAVRNLKGSLSKEGWNANAIAENCFEPEWGDADNLRVLEDTAEEVQP